ncbi:RbsD/FucU family protein [Pseudoroseomonas cervicalis]|uniref:RbsD/FucU family protein n=1 Tax=Teichococcus cervicalis TaxID=204525 RepID=UPI0022F16E69|nr:RbsD/FucU domain-containing protein [Pseudoroseomonas cervicalis]WBV44984.1 ribose ABC transporter [Pseudoroseomonas cervicalis]
MLKGIDPLLTPDLLHTLCAMGHGDSLVIADANFPASARARRLLRLPGSPADAVLRAILSVLPIDDFIAHPVRSMQVVGDVDAVPEAVQAFTGVLAQHGQKPPAPLERHAFYAEAERAYAIVQTGERRLYGNLLLTKGVIV